MSKSTNHVIELRTRKVPWLRCCRYCGLVALNNEATRREMKKPCRFRMELTEEEEGEEAGK